MFSLNGTLKKDGSVGRWEMKQFIGMALVLASRSNTDNVRKIATTYIIAKIKKLAMYYHFDVIMKLYIYLVKNFQLCRKFPCCH